MTARNITQQPECHTFNGAAPNLLVAGLTLDD